MASLNAIISADVSGFKKSIEDAKRVLNQYSDSVSKQNKINRISDGITQEQVNSYNRVVKALEKVNSGTMSTTQQSKALQNQIKELKIQWANLNETAKNSDFGKALSNSMKKAENQLSQTKAQLASVEEQTKKSSTSTSSFDNVLNLATSTLGKVAIGYGSLKTAQEIFDRCIQSNQQSADNFDVVMKVLNTSVSNFFNAISTGDFSKFDRGIANMISRAKEAQQALDQLGNSSMSLSIKQVKLQNKISNAKAILYDEKATKQEKEKAKKDMQDAYKELNESVDVVVNDYKDSIVKAVKGSANIDLTGEDLSVIEKWLEVDATKGRQAAKDWAEQQYKEYLDAKKKLAYKTGQVVTATDLYNSNTSGKQSKRDNQTYSKEIEELNKQYKEAIIYNELLNNYSDSELNNLGQMVIQQVNLTNQRNNDLATIEKIDKKISNTSGNSNKTVNIELTPEWKQHSLDLAAQQAKETLEDALTKNDIKVGIQLVPVGQPLDEMELDTESYERAISLNDNIIEGWKKQQQEIINTKQAQKDLIDSAQNINGAVQSLYNGFRGLAESWEDMDGAERFFAISDAIFSSINAVQSMAESINNIIQLFNLFKTTSSAAAKATVADNAAVTASEQTKQAAETGSAAAGIFSAHSNIPWVGVAIAIAMIGMMIATMSQFHKGGIVGKFANGGIIQGASKLGDMNLARVNDGEMILNSSQQSHLFNLLNSSGGYQNSSSNGNVEFKIKGETLVGVLNNFNKRINKI